MIEYGQAGTEERGRPTGKGAWSLVQSSPVNREQP